MWKYYDQKRIDQFVHDLREKYSSDILEVTDHLGRSLLHVAVEQGNHLFAECILSAGFSPNIKEKCGATPLTISMCNKDLRFANYWLTRELPYVDHCLIVCHVPLTLPENLS